MSEVFEKQDRLRLADRAEVKKMIAKLGDADEAVLYSDIVTKINKRGREQSRAMMITDKAVYNLKPNDFSKCKRRIAVEGIASVTVSHSSSHEFAIHVPEEYDYRFKSEKKADIAKCLSIAHRQITGAKLHVNYIHETALKTVTVTKDEAKAQTRDDIMRRRKLLATEEHDSDREEDDAVEPADTIQLIHTKEKVCLDDFDLLKVIGRGSFGKVMLVRKKSSGKIFAMKILKKALVVERNQVEHTKSERNILQNVSHPYLMALRFAFQSKQKLYFVLDYYKGGELFFHLKHKRRFTEDVARFFVAQVGLALGHLHSFQIIYRDLKPENILMDDLGNLCLTDFGLSKDVNPNEQAKTFAGTPEYLSPEVIRGNGHGKAVDWWSLGILLFELTVGIPPFYSANVNEMYQKIESGTLRFPPFLSHNCKDLIIRLLNRDPEHRMGSSERDFDELREHPFFSTIDWDAMMRKEIPPPYVPSIKGADSDTSNFDAQFTSEPVVDSFAAESALSQGFDQFTFLGDTGNL